MANDDGGALRATRMSASPTAHHLAESVKAGIQGAWLNVLINVGSLKDQEFAAEYRAKGEALLAHALPLADECYAEIVKLIEG